MAVTRDQVSRRVELLALAAVVCCVGHAAAAGQFATPGPAPDVIGAFNALDTVGYIAADGSFIYQSTFVQEAFATYVGRYLSHQCNPDGSFYTDYLQYAFNDDGTINSTTPGCGTGIFVDGLFSSTFALTETGICPIPATAQTETAYLTFVPGSSLGRLLNGTYCSPLRRGVLDHPIYPSRDGLSPLAFFISNGSAA